MKKIYLIRHGHTDWNGEDRLQGSMDIELNDLGRRAAELLAERLRRERIDVIYSSPLKRAYETALIINKFHNVEIIILEELHEIRCGEFEGLYYHEIKEKFPDFWEKWRTSPRIPMPGGESIEDVWKRAKKALEKVFADEREHVLISGHGAMNRMVMSAFMGIDPQTARFFKQENAALNILEAKGNRRYLVLWNDISHLEQIND